MVDLRGAVAPERAFTDALQRFGRIDGLFAIAGASGRLHGDGPLRPVPLDRWQATFELNAGPTFMAARKAVCAIQSRSGDTPGGSIVLMSSILARHPSPELFATPAHAAAKGAILAPTTTTAAYYAPEGIRINAIAPSLVATPMAARAAEDPTAMRYATAKQPMAGGMLAPADVAGAAAFLLSAGARMITGQLLEVDGGWSVTETGGRQ